MRRRLNGAAGKVLACLLCLTVILSMAGGALAAEDFHLQWENRENFTRLADTLLQAYEEPSDGTMEEIDAIVEEIRAVSEADGEVALSMADHWKKVYLDPDYPMYLYQGGKTANVLMDAGIPNSAKHAFVVLGYQLQDGEMADELKGRCNAAAAAARSFPGTILICTGGATGANNPDGHTEAGMMKEYLVKQCGIAPSRIRTDERAMTTVANAVNTFRIMKKEEVTSYTIVTSAYHQRWGQATYNLIGALYRQSEGYEAELIANYSYDYAPTVDAYKREAQVGYRQLTTILGMYGFKK